MLMKNGKHADE